MTESLNKSVESFNGKENCAKAPERRKGKQPKKQYSIFIDILFGLLSVPFYFILLVFLYICVPFSNWKDGLSAQK